MISAVDGNGLLQLVYQTGRAGGIVRLRIFGRDGGSGGNGTALCLARFFVIAIRTVDIVQRPLTIDGVVQRFRGPWRLGMLLDVLLV